MRDLIDRVKERLGFINVSIPMESWVRFQFQPKDLSTCSAASLNYTNRYDIINKVQSRSIHINHPCIYFCMTIFSHMKERVKSFCNFLFEV